MGAAAASQDPAALQATVLRLQAVTHSGPAKLQEKMGGCCPPSIVCIADCGWKRGDENREEGLGMTG